MVKSIELVIGDMLESYLSKHQFELVDIEYVNEAGNWFLRVFVDKEGGIDIDDCEQISEFLSKKLDENDPISTAYFLEVSSPGAERPLRKPKDFEDAIGRAVYCSTYEPIHQMKEFEGKLISYDGQTIVIEVNLKGRLKQFELPVAKIALARLAVLL